MPIEVETLQRSWPVLAWVPLDVRYDDGERAVHQVLVGMAPTAPAEVPAAAIIGEVPTPDGWAVAYDALWDPQLALAMARLVAPDLSFRSARQEGGDRTNSSVVLDDRWSLKVYRRLHEGPNPDVEATVALGRLGLTTVPVPAAVWRRHDWDLAAVRRWHPEARSGHAVANESIMDLLTTRRPPRESRHDFRAGAEALGRTVAEVHVGLAEAFGAERCEPDRLVDDLVSRLHGAHPAGVDLDRIEATYRRLAHGTDLGWMIRVHGDLHLGRVLLTRKGWWVTDFEGEPSRAIEERRRPSSPLRDVAGMIRSFHYAVELAMSGASPDPAPTGSDEPPEGPRPIDPPGRELAVLAEAWEERATNSFLRGYTSVDAVHRLLPEERLSRDALLTVFELDRAVVEVADELAHRPQLAGIPRAAVDRLSDPEHSERW